MKKRNTNTNPIFREIRKLEEKAAEAGIIEKSDVKTSEAMRKEAWEWYLMGRMKWLESMLKDKELEA